MCVCLFEEKSRRESLEHFGGGACGSAGGAREFERTWSVPVCCNAEAARPREARGVCVIASGDNPTAAQYVRVSWRCRRESAWVAVSEKVTKAVCAGANDATARASREKSFIPAA